MSSRCVRQTVALLYTVQITLQAGLIRQNFNTSMEVLFINRCIEGHASTSTLQDYIYYLVFEAQL
jgi:hypothetical protein